MISDEIYRIAATSVVMNGEDFTTSDQSEPDETRYVSTRIKIRQDIYNELKKEGLDVNTVVNRLLENFILAYRTFWQMYNEKKCSGGDLNPGRGSESPT